MDEKNTEEQIKEKKKINKKEIWRAVKFTLFSISAGAIQMVSALLLKLVILDRCIPEGATIHFITDLTLDTFIADTVGLALSILWNFTFNRKFTFKAANNVPIAMLLAFAFYVPFYPFQIWYIDAVEKSLVNIGDWAFVIAQGTCMLINFVLEFLWQKFVVFRNAEDTNEQAKKKQENTAEAEAEEQPVLTEQDNGIALAQKIEVDVILKNAGSNKIAVIKVIRNATGLDLEQAKKLVDSAPATIAEKRLKDEAEKLSEELRRVGAEVELR